eukprot:TRINITY_DN4376_c0_g1_i3.p1 TRINITY_DN4376_c0_g1~~TRINITY_DN4376_c0_g1_i3.p1  ORF type:complete len:798 (-),score=201.74 TRINITY_DN4376_c0_g1_i3:2315-4708(-)
MQAINGYMYCNSPTFTMNQGERVRWYVLSVGDALESYAIEWAGQSLLRQGRQTASLGVVPGSSSTVDMVADNPGTWLVQAHSASARDSGMMGLFQVNAVASAAVPVLSGVTRDYFLQVATVNWDYVPNGVYACSKPASKSVLDGFAKYINSANDRVGRVYSKSRFTAYTDASFASPISLDSDLGLAGPILRAEVGDTVRVTVRNTSPYTIGLNVQGALVDKANEGRVYFDGSSTGSTIAPGATATVVWKIPDRAGPRSTDASSLMWVYHGDTASASGVHTGLFGPLLVYRQGTLGSNNLPTGIDKEYVRIMTVIDENRSDYASTNFAARLSGGYQSGNRLATLRNDPLFLESNRMHNINGYMYCSGPKPTMATGNNVRWHVASLGADQALHTVNWGGGAPLSAGRRLGAISLLPSSITVGDAVPQIPGTFQLLSRTGEDLQGGMMAEYVVSGSSLAGTHGKTRELYIAADEVEWNYAPRGRNMCLDQPFGENNDGKTTLSADDRIGTTYVKAIYREYTDKTFANIRSGSESRENEASVHLGMIGPVLRARVGDRIRVTFKNRARFPFNIEIPSLFLAQGNTSAVAPGSTVVYEWMVTREAGPGPEDPSSIAWLYQSTVDPVADVHAGLFGVVVVSRREDSHGDDASPRGFQREFVSLMARTDENKSPYINVNIRKYVPDATQFLDKTYQALDDDFKESNVMSHINGYTYCNSPGLAFTQGMHTRWYVASISGNHVPRWHGMLVKDGFNAGVHGVGSFATGVRDIQGQHTGVWLLHDASANENEDDGVGALIRVIGSL